MSARILTCLFRRIGSVDSAKRLVCCNLNLNRSMAVDGRQLNLRESSNQSNNKSSDYEHEERQFFPVTLDQFEPLFRENPKLESIIANILNIYEHEKYTTSLVPSSLTIENMQVLLKVYPDEKELNRSLKFFFKIQSTRYNDQRKQQKKKQERIEAKLKKYNKVDVEGLDNWSAGIWSSDGQLDYGLWHNSLLSRITKQAIRDYRHNHLLRQTAMFGQKLIVDLDYDQHMKPYECRLLAQQIGILYYENRLNRDHPEALPFDVHFTNCGASHETMPALAKHMKRMDQLGDYFHRESYLKLGHLFPRDRLIYLSPHARQSLPNSYCHDDIFILGGYNDRTSKVRASHIKAESEGVRCYRLPLDENVLWKQGNKNLCLNQVSAILQSVKATGNWRTAIQDFAPQRKIRSPEEAEIEKQIQMKRMSKRMNAIQKSFVIGQTDSPKGRY